MYSRCLRASRWFLTKDNKYSSLSLYYSLSPSSSHAVIFPFSLSVTVFPGWPTCTDLSREKNDLAFLFLILIKIQTVCKKITVVYNVPYDKNITWKKVKGKQYYLPYNNKAAGKNIKWGRGGKFWGRKIKI